ncbi:MAG: Exo-beta-D-glucosaminidase precursor [Verrucomicrobiota bacterium]|jgi:hypothetical protein
MSVMLDLTTQEWSLTGWRPFAWKLRKSAETGGFLLPDHGSYPARMPGSRDLGCNRLRVWGGGYFVSVTSYAACDRAGRLVWQEFPLSLSELESNPPGDDAFPCLANTAIVDFDHALKPAAHALAQVFKQPP